MDVLKNIYPEGMFRYFEELCAIPHGSGNTRQISDYCVEFARKHGFEYYQDGANNVIIIKPATKGYEEAAPVIIQGHLDMVCEKAAESSMDFFKDGLELIVEGDYIRANGTTLGGDDGIAVAMALALMDDNTVSHPRLEAVFTTDEEIGMLGAAVLDVSMLKGRKLINIDSEAEGIFTVSCAGGICSTCILPVQRDMVRGIEYDITIDGLIGGHSGVEIDKGRANSSVLMGRLLYSLSKELPINIMSLSGGMKDNAIPVKTRAAIVLNSQDVDKAEGIVEGFRIAFKNEYITPDPDIRISTEISEETKDIWVLNCDSTRKVIGLLMLLPNGIQAMSMDIPGLVQTSLNMGILILEEDALRCSFAVRSSIDSQKKMLNDRLSCMMELLGGRMEFMGDYPGWEFKKDSDLREILVQVYREQYGSEPKIEAIHAGLECGMFSGKLPGLDCISFGPNLIDIHTYRERMSISSVQRVWNFLLEAIRRMQ